MNIMNGAIGGYFIGGSCLFLLYTRIFKSGLI